MKHNLSRFSSTGTNTLHYYKSYSLIYWTRTFHIMNFLAIYRLEYYQRSKSVSTWRFLSSHSFIRISPKLRLSSNIHVPRADIAILPRLPVCPIRSAEITKSHYFDLTSVRTRRKKQTA